MFQLLRSLSTNRRLLGNFVMRDLRSRYVGSSMGFFWSVIFPIINLFVFMFVFRLVLRARWSDFQGAEEVSLVMLSGIVVWSAFAESMSRTTNTLVENSNLIQKVVFPSEVLPTFIVISSIINMVIALPIVLLAVAYFIWIDPVPNIAEARVGQTVAGLVLRWVAHGGAAPFEANPDMATSLGARIAWGQPIPLERAHWDALMLPTLQIGKTLLVLPLLVTLQAIFTTGLGMFFSAFNLFWRDTYHLMGVAITVWMFATPIFYPGHMVETAGFGWLLQVNPMYWLIESYRAVLLYNEWPDLWFVGRFTLVAVVGLWLGATFFLRQRRHFPDLL